MIITLSGMPGSGKTTLAKRLKEALGFEHYYAGGMQRSIANDKGMTLEEWNAYCDTHPEADNEIDYYMERLGKTADNIIVEGRTAKHFIPDSVGIFMLVDYKVGAERVMKEIAEKEGSRNEADAASVEEKARLMEQRAKTDRERYLSHYGVDISDPEMYDLLIDTTDMTIDEVFDKVLAFIKQMQKGGQANSDTSNPNL